MMRFRLPLIFGVVWAAAMIAAALLLPENGSWTIDDSVKRIAAEQAPGLWAERIPDGPRRSKLADPALFPPLHPPFASRTEGGFACGFSPWTRGFSKLLMLAGPRMWRVFPVLIAIAFGALLLWRGFPWAFVLLPLTFYGLIPWEHALSWLLMWPAVETALKQRSERSEQKQTGVIASGILLVMSVLLRPETALLAAVLVLYLLSIHAWKKAWWMFGGAAAGLGGMLLWHKFTSTEAAFAQINLNLLGSNVTGGIGHFLLSRPAALYGLLLRMDLVPWISLSLLAGFAIGAVLLFHAEKKKSKTLLGLALAIFAVWFLVYQYRLWSAVLPPLVLMYANSLLVCAPWIVITLRPPYRSRPAFWLALISISAGVLLAPVWEGVHWGPRILLFALPLLLWDLYQSDRARGYAFHVLLALTALQTVSSGVLVYARAVETSNHIKRAVPYLGTPVICPTMSQCVDFAPLWKNDEFFTAADPEEFKQLLIELRSMPVDTVWLHMDARDPLYIKAFPDAKPVWPHRMIVLQAGNLYRTQWRIMQLVMNRTDSLWAPILESEAGRRMLNHDSESALQLQQEAVAVAPGSAQSHHNLALIYAARGDTASARDEAANALQLDPDLKETRQLLEMLRSPQESAP